MSTEYNADCFVGFAFQREDIPARYRKNKPEKSHIEKRFDPKTGKPTLDEKVIDSEEEDVLIFDGEEFEDEHEFFDVIAAEVGGTCCMSGNFIDGDMVFMIEPPIKTKHERYLFEDVVKSAKTVRSMYKKLKKLGFKVTAPVVMGVLTIS